MYDGIYRLEEMLCDELSDMGSKGSINTTMLERVDTMSHALKNIQKIITYYENMGYSGEEGYSGYQRVGDDRSYNDRSYRRSYDDGNSYGRKRDRMGRFSRASSPDEMKHQLRQMANDAPSSKIKKEIEELIADMDRA